MTKSIDSKIDELARMAAEGFLEVHKKFAEVRAEMATRADLVCLRADMEGMIDHHVGVFRTDYDDLTARTRKLEQAVFTI